MLARNFMSGSIAATVLAGLAQAQVGTVHVVLNGTNLQGAVDAAQEGDTLLLKAGIYPTGATLDGKGLNLVADGPGAVVLGGGLRISNLASSAHVVLSGLQVQGEAWTGAGSGRALVVDNTAGAVRVDRCTFRGREVGHAALIHGAADFVAAGSQFFGGNVAVWSPASEFLFAGAGLGASGASRVAVYSTLVRGADALDALSYSEGQWGGVGGFINGGRFHASASSFVGGRGGRPFGQCTFGGNGGSGLWVTGQQRARSISSTFTGGSGAQGNNCFCAGCFNGEPGQAFAGPVLTLPSTPTTLVLPRVARESTVVDVHIGMQPGANGFLVASQHAAHGFDIAYNGPVLVRGPYELRMPLGVATSGSLALQVTLPTLPTGVESQTWLFQVVVRSPTGGAFAGECRPLVIVDDAF